MPQKTVEKQPPTFQQILEMLGFFTNKELTASTIVECIIRDSEINIINTYGTNIFTVIKTGRDTGDVIIGNYTAGQGIKWDASTGLLDIQGGLTVDELHIPDQATANSFHVDTDGNAWWGSILIADAVAKVLKTGVATFKSVILQDSVKITDLVAGSEVAIQQWMSNLTFSATDYRIAAWTSGTITLMDGTTFTISSGNTGNMSALTYIYLDKAVSSTVLQTTTTPATAVGTGKVLLAVAQNISDTSKYAKFQVFSGSGGVGGSFIAADNIIVTTLAAIVANMGAITAGTITVDTSGYIRGGQTDYNTGTGFFLGYSGGAYKFSIGVSTGNFLTWDGSTLRVQGGVSPSQWVASDDSLVSADNSYSGQPTTAVMVKEIVMQGKGTLRIKFDIYGDANAVSNSGWGRIYKNSSTFGTIRYVTGSYVTHSEDLAFSSGDLIQIYMYNGGFSGAGQDVYCRNFRLYGVGSNAFTVNTN